MEFADAAVYKVGTDLADFWQICHLKLSGKVVESRDLGSRMSTNVL